MMMITTQIMIIKTKISQQMFKIMLIILIIKMNKTTVLFYY